MSGATRTSTVWPFSPGTRFGARCRRHGDHLEHAALRVVVVDQRRHRDLAAGSHFGHVGAGDRRLVEHDAVGDGDDHRGADRIGPAVGDLVAERRSRRRVGAHRDEVADALDLLDRHALVGSVPDEADDVAVGVAVVVEHVDEAGAAGSDHDVVAHGDRRPVLRRLADLDADLGDVALLAVGGRVVEDVGARRGGVEEELPVRGQRDVELVGGLTFGAHERRLLGDEQRVVVGVGVVVEHVEPHGLADDRDAGVVAGVRLVVGVLQPHVDDHRAGVGRAEVVADRVRQLDALGRAVRVGGEDDLARRIAHEDAGRARRVGQIDRLEDERVAVGIDVVGEDVERRRPAPAGRGDVVVRFRWPVRRAIGRADLRHGRRPWPCRRDRR